MKKLIIIISLMLLILAPQAFAAWTITATMDSAGSTQIVIKLECISDASASGTYEITTDSDGRNIMNRIKGWYLYGIKTVPGTGGDQPTGTFDLDVEDAQNFHVLDTDANANDADTFTYGHDTLGIFPPVLNKIYVVIGTLGDANTADIYLYFVK